MKHFFLAVFCILSATVSKTFSYEPTWIRSHYIALGADFSLSKGHFNGKKILSASDEEGVEPENTAVPELGHFIVPNVELGANMNAHTIAVSLGIWKPKLEYAKNSNDPQEERALFWRLGVEYRYYFFWPEKFQFGLGLNYSFTRISVPHAVSGYDSMGSSTTGKVIFSGNGAALVTSGRYYLNDHFALEASFKPKIISFGFITTPANGFSGLDDSLWQFFAELGVKAVIQF